MENLQDQHGHERNLHGNFFCPHAKLSLELSPIEMSGWIPPTSGKCDHTLSHIHWLGFDQNGTIVTTEYYICSTIVYEGQGYFRYWKLNSSVIAMKDGLNVFAKKTNEHQCLSIFWTLFFIQSSVAFAVGSNTKPSPCCSRVNRSISSQSKEVYILS